METIVEHNRGYKMVLTIKQAKDRLTQSKLFNIIDDKCGYDVDSDVDSLVLHSTRDRST